MTLRLTCIRSGKRNSGFTLIELMVVIGILTIMMGIGIPMFLRVLPNFRLREAARQVAQDMNLARMRAISTNQNYGIFFNSSGATVQGTRSQCYTLFQDSGTVAGQLDSNDHLERLNWSLPETITFQGVTFANNTVIFRPRSNSNGGTVALRNQKGKITTVDVLTNTARVKIL